MILAPTVRFGVSVTENLLLHLVVCILLLSVREAPWSSGWSSSVSMQKVAVKCEFEARLRHSATGKISLSTQQ